MNQESISRSMIWNRPKPPVVIASALFTLTLLLGACGGGSDATATPASLPTAVATIAGTTTEAASPTATSASASGALTETEQAAETSGITEGAASSGASNAAVITSTELVTGTEVLTNINVSTNTVVIEQNLITTVITNTNLVSNVVQSNESSSASESSVTTATAQLTPESSVGQAVVDVTVTPLAPTPTTAVRNTSEVSGTATPQPTSNAQSSGSQVLTRTAPVAAGTLFTGVTDAQGKAILASTLLGSKFLTSDGEISGQLDDLVVDMQSSQLLYLLLNYGGVLDVGETSVAVPLNALSLKEDGTFLLNIPPEHLQQFPDLEDDWPQAGSPNWDTDVRNFWDKEGFPVSFDPSVSGNRIRRIAGWTGASLNDIGYGDGTANDVIVALDQGRVPYVLVSFANAPAVNGADANAPAATTTPLAGGNNAAAGTAGDNNWYAVPLTAFDPQNPELALRSDVNSTIFEGAPRFNRDSQGDNPFLPANYDEDWQVFWKKLTTPNP